MIRPCFLVVDPEHSGSISTRKLVIESAKFNVITAYSSQEAIDTFRKYPAVDGVVIDADMEDMATDKFVQSIKKINSRLPVIIVGYPSKGSSEDADHQLETFEPRRLLDLLQRLCPESTSQISNHERKLEEKGE
jgi:DNA-binding NtrC family response regulator